MTPPYDPGDGTAGTHGSIWIETTPDTDYPSLEGDRRVDTAVIGGGIVGITAAARLDAEGQSVALVERDRIVGGTTGHTTAKVTSLHGLRYHWLERTKSPKQARLYGCANQTAIEDLAETVAELDVDCEFERATAYTYTTDPSERDKIEREVAAAERSGLPASYVESVDLPVDVAAAVAVENQARFHPRKYLLALADRIDGGGSDVYEETPAVDVTEGRPCRVETERGTVIADDVIVASHFPVSDEALYFARMYPKRSYVIAARLDGDVPEGMYYRSSEPYFSVRPAGNAGSVALIGGQNHRTGHGGGTRERYRRLEQQARDRFDVEAVEYRWSTQDYVSVDRVPFVGRLSPRSRHRYVATGFGGWGMSNGLAAGRLLAHLVRGGESPYQAVFRPARLSVGASARSAVSHNATAAADFVGDYLAGRPSLSTVDLDRDEAIIADGDDGPVAVYRDESGEYHTLSAVCTHMDCLVRWNDGERSWDCPCHGSRFDYDGTVLDTPAIDGLPEYEGPDLPGRRTEPPARPEEE